MSKKLKVVAIAGSPQRPSRTLALVEEILIALGALVPIEVHLIDLNRIGPKFAGVLKRAELPADLQEDIAAIEGADFIVAASPVYRASYTGLFKHLFDFVHHEALFNVPVLLAASGGSDRHALVIEHQLRPLFSFFQALTLPVGVYATESDFSNYQVSSATLRARIGLAVSRALPLLTLRDPALAAA